MLNNKIFMFSRIHVNKHGPKYFCLLYSIMQDLCFNFQLYLKRNIRELSLHDLKRCFLY